MLLRLLIPFLLFLSTLTTNAQDLKWIPFNWSGDSVSGRYFEKLAIKVPVTIDNIPARFEMQFDLGAVTTVIYGKTILPYLSVYPGLKNKIDTSKTFFIQSQKNPMFTNMELKMGEADFKGISIGYFKDFGDSLTRDSALTNTVKHIGTIGPDLFQNSILLIDYAKNRIGICKELPAEYKKAVFQPFRLDNGRIKIPLVIGDSTRYFLFDTGSSIFSLTASKEDALQTANPKIEDSLMVSSWGQMITFYGVKTKKAIKFGNKALDGSLIYYDEKRTFEDFYKSEHIWGLTGNVFFLKNTVIIDYKNKLFGVL